LYAIGGYSPSYLSDVQVALINVNGANAADFTGTVPSGLTAITATEVNGCSDAGVMITWAADPIDWGDHNSGTRAYDVLRDGTAIATGIAYGTTTYTDTTGTNGTTYFYTIRYNNGCSLSAITNDVGAWTATSSFTLARFSHTSVAYNGYLYVIGGYSGSYRNDVQVAPINANGTVGAWTATTSFTTARYGHTSVAYNGYLYVIGGYSPSYLSNVQYAPINANGTVGTWTATTGFTTGRFGHTSVAYNGYLYVIGGYSGSSLNDVQYAPINANGTIGTWTTTTGFPTARRFHTSVAYNGHLYVIGGLISSSPYDLFDIQHAPINADGTIGTWTATTSFPIARDSHTSVAYNGYLYILGGYGGSSLNDVQVASINANGTIGGWTATTSFPIARYNHTSVAYTGYLYVIGGYGGSYRNDVQFALINAKGANAADNVDVIPCPDVANTLQVSKSGADAVISWTGVACADLANYRVYGATAYNASFPSAWAVLGNPSSPPLNDAFSSSYVAYRTVSVDNCGNLSP
jgi:N-acetylneuraminic acid mutarotase